MRKMKREALLGGFAIAPRFQDCVENDKRRRALGFGGGIDLESKLFFERVLNVKKIREFVFISKSVEKGR